ncbi:hypothetical protein CBL_01783 [Carabus blaptoides fortunei]
MANNKERDKFCEKCKKEFDGVKIVGCEGNCANWFHEESSGLTNKQYQVLENCDAMKWFSVKQVVSELLELNMFTTNEHVTYAEKTKTSKRKGESVLLVKPVATQKADKTKNEVKEKVSPENIAVGVSTLKQISGGAIIIGCDSAEDRDKLKTEVINKMGNKYKVEIPKLYRPKIKLIGVYLHDDEEDLVEKICKQNAINEHEEFYMKILKKIENKKMKNFDIIIEVDKITHKMMINQGMIKVGWSRGKVVDHVYVKKCFKCWGFNHIAKDCKADIICANCAEMVFM